MSGLELLPALALAGSAVSAGVGLYGASVQADAQREAGENEQRAREMQAQAEERQGNEVQAASQREAEQRAQKARVLLSRQQAVAAASGGGASDPTVLKLMGDTAAEGEYQSLSALYEGKAKAAGLEDDAALQRWRGRQARTAGYTNANATMLSGVSGFARAASSGISDFRKRA